MLQVLDALVLDLKLEGVDKQRGVVQHVDGRYVDGCHPPVVVAAAMAESQGDSVLQGRLLRNFVGRWVPVELNNS